MDENKKTKVENTDKRKIDDVCKDNANKDRKDRQGMHSLQYLGKNRTEKTVQVGFRSPNPSLICSNICLKYFC